MKTSVYFEAAQLLPAADGMTHSMIIGGSVTAYGCCDAIGAACNRKPATYEERSGHITRFCRIFRPVYSRADYWFDYDEQDEPDYDEENCAKARVLALLFMHWMTVDP